MTHHYYPVTLTAVQRELSCPPVNEPTRILHLQWMCGQLENMDPFSLSAALKAARWIGWILRDIEAMNIWPNSVSRDLVRADALGGFDRPLKELVAA